MSRRGLIRRYIFAGAALRLAEVQRRYWSDGAGAFHRMQLALVRAEAAVAAGRHLDALRELYIAEDLEFELIGDCSVINKAVALIAEELGLTEEQTGHAWLCSSATRRPGERT